MKNNLPFVLDFVELFIAILLNFFLSFGGLFCLYGLALLSASQRLIISLNRIYFLFFFIEFWDLFSLFELVRSLSFQGFFLRVSQNTKHPNAPGITECKCKTKIANINFFVELFIAIFFKARRLRPWYRTLLQWLKQKDRKLAQVWPPWPPSSIGFFHRHYLLDCHC